MDAIKWIEVEFEQLESVFDVEKVLEEGVFVIYDELEVYMFILVFYDVS